MDFTNWKCRCSSISKMMANGKGSEPVTEKQWETVREIEKKINIGKATDKQMMEYTRLLKKDEDSKEVVPGDSCIAYLLEAYAWETEQMCSITKEMDVEYFERGRKTEPESIELLSFVDDTAYIKNELRFENDFLSGIPDILTVEKNYLGHDDYNEYCGKIRDIKSCKDYPTFLYKIHKGLDPGNKEQLQGYGDILECEDLGVAFTLPTMPQEMREGYKLKLAYKMNAAIDQDPEFDRAWANLERSMIFDHMAPAKRVYKIPVQPFTKADQQAVYDRVKYGRDWLNDFHEQYLKLNQ